MASLGLPRISPLSWAIERLLPGEIVKICPRSASFSLRFFKSDRLLGPSTGRYSVRTLLARQTRAQSAHAVDLVRAERIHVEGGAYTPVWFRLVRLGFFKRRGRKVTKKEADDGLWLHEQPLAAVLQIIDRSLSERILAQPSNALRFDPHQTRDMQSCTARARKQERAASMSAYRGPRRRPPTFLLQGNDKVAHPQ